MEPTGDAHAKVFVVHNAQQCPGSRLPPLTPAAQRVLLVVLLGAEAHLLVVAVTPRVLLEGAIREKDKPVGRWQAGLRGLGRLGRPYGQGRQGHTCLRTTCQPTIGCKTDTSLW